MIEKFEINEKIFLWLNSFSGKDIFLDNVFIFITEYLIYAMILFFIFYFSKKIWEDKKIELREIFLYFTIPFITWFFAKAIKFLLPTERPFVSLENVNKLVSESANSSFPSGHSTMAFALATAMYFYSKKVGWVFFMMAFLVAISRPIVGVHFPLDIFVGMVLGILVPNIFHFLWKRYKK